MADRQLLNAQAPCLKNLGTALALTLVGSANYRTTFPRSQS